MASLTLIPSTLELALQRAGLQIEEDEKGVKSKVDIHVNRDYLASLIREARNAGFSNGDIRFLREFAPNLSMPSSDVLEDVLSRARAGESIPTIMGTYNDHLLYPESSFERDSNRLELSAAPALGSKIVHSPQKSLINF